MYLGLELVVDEVGSEDIIVTNGIVINCAFNVSGGSRIDLVGVCLTQEPMTSQLAQWCLSQQSLVDEHITVAQVEVKVSSSNLNSVGRGEVDREDSHDNRLSDLELTTINLNSCESLLGRTSSD